MELFIFLKPRGNSVEMTKELMGLHLPMATREA